MLSLVKAISEVGLEVEMSQASDSLASRGINRVSADFLYSDCQEMLVIDCDLIVTARDLKYLFSHDVELVYGPYVKRQPVPELCLASLRDGDTPDPSNPLWEVRRAGKGFVRIKRSLLERMKSENGGPAKRFTNHGRNEWDFWPVGVVDGEFSVTGQPEYLSEDWMFCERARAMGAPIYVDHRILAAHEGSMIFPISRDTVREITEKMGNAIRAL